MTEPVPTPIMAQYLALKAAHPGCLLFFRMGDFFELFFEDAGLAADTLGIKLTKRGQHDGRDIAMAGVPVARADEYLRRLIAAGHRVAVAEQIEDAKAARARGGKSIVARAVVRLVTPGTITEDSLLEPGQPSWLTAVHTGEERAALASLDISTGASEIIEVALADLPGELARLRPAEILLGDSCDAQARDMAEGLAPVTAVPAQSFRPRAGEDALRRTLGVAALDAFGPFTAGELAAAGALLRYVELTQAGGSCAMMPPRRAGADAVMRIDAATRVSLEIATSLLAAIDRTMTGAGRRELAARLGAPLTDPGAIDTRLDAVAYCMAESVRGPVRAALRGMPDLARALGRLACGRGQPRDLAAVADVLRAGATIVLPQPWPPEIAGIAAGLAAPPGLAAQLAQLAEPVPAGLRDAGIIRAGVDAPLDAARDLAAAGQAHVAALQARYAAATGVRALKIRHNAVLGYFVEVAAAAGKTLTACTAPPFRHRQSMAGTQRYTTDELAQLEADIAQAGETALLREGELVAALLAAVAAHGRALARLAEALAQLDVYAALAELAVTQRYARPVVDRSAAIEIIGGRHPVVEQALAKARGGTFIENDCSLDGDAAPIWLVTGPNMAGKSTFLRQTALIAILAQMGAFVPAEAARVGVVDRLFSRVGAADELARGRSTFMVEMVETATILRQATRRSLVILDEIGRGTATHDGLAIACATLEHLHDAIGCRTLFATHYHELAALTHGRRIVPVTMAVREWREGIVFLHRVASGSADRSYGIQVARLAGMPPSVVARAAAVLAAIDKHGPKLALGDVLAGLPLFAAQPLPPPASRIEEALAALDLDTLSPREAQAALYELRALLPETR